MVSFCWDNKWMFEIWGLVFGCENWVVEKVFVMLLEFLVVLGYESCKCSKNKGLSPLRTVVSCLSNQA